MCSYPALSAGPQGIDGSILLKMKIRKLLIPQTISFDPFLKMLCLPLVKGDTIECDGKWTPETAVFKQFIFMACCGSIGTCILR